jgi:hypothetical protein
MFPDVGGTLRLADSYEGLTFQARSSVVVKE